MTFFAADATTESRDIIPSEHIFCNVKPTSNIFSPSLHINTNSDKHPKDKKEYDCLPNTVVIIHDSDGLDQSSSAIKEEEEEVHLNNEVHSSLFDLATLSPSPQADSGVQDSFDEENIGMKRRRIISTTSSDKVIVSDAAMLLSLFEI